MFRETSATLLPAVGLWYLLVQRREQLRQVATYKVFVPYGVVCVCYYILRTKLLTEPFANPDIYGFGSHFDNFWWYYIKNALLPFRDPVAGWRVQAQWISGIAILAVIPIALNKRKWGLLALSVAVVLGVVPTAAALLGAGQRYFYFCTLVLAMALGLATAEAKAWFNDRVSAYFLGPAMGFGAAVAVSVIGGYIVFDRNDKWEQRGPDREQAWVSELHTEFPTLPSGGTLFCSHLPPELVVYEASYLLPTVRWLYPGVGNAVWVPDRVPVPPLGPDDRVFIAGDGLLLGDTTAQP